MKHAKGLLPLAAAVLLAGCQPSDDSGPWYQGTWKLDLVCSGWGPCREPTADDRFQFIELSEDRFVEYWRDGTVRLSVPATYLQRQCIDGREHVYLLAEGGPGWCLDGDDLYLSGQMNVYDGGGYGFRRLPFR